MNPKRNLEILASIKNSGKQESKKTLSPDAKAKKIIKWSLMALCVFIFIFAVGSLESDPGDKQQRQDRSLIEQCWGNQAKKSNSPKEARVIASFCEKYELEFRDRYKSNP